MSTPSGSGGPSGEAAHAANRHLQASAHRHMWLHFTRMSSYAEGDMPVIVRGSGQYVYDNRGKRYLDGLSGLFVPIESLPPLLRALARVLPLTYAVSLLRGIWRGEGWSAHLGDVAVLAVTFLVLMAASSRVFRWE